MIDPLTALSVASTAVSQMRTLINTGRDTSQAISKFAGAWTDIQEADRRAKNPKWWQSFDSSIEKRAADAFAARKKAQELKKELENMIRFVHGPTGLQEYKDIIRDMRKQKERHEFRKQRIKEAIIEWIVGLLAAAVGIAIMATVLYFIGKNEGKW
jgi:hypothetical protein